MIRWPKGRAMDMLLESFHAQLEYVHTACTFRTDQQLASTTRASTSCLCVENHPWCAMGAPNEPEYNTA